MLSLDHVHDAIMVFVSRITFIFIFSKLTYLGLVNTIGEW